MLVPPGRDPAPDRIVATLSDGRSFLAKAVGLDCRLDLAVLKIDASCLVPASFRDPATLSRVRMLLTGSQLRFFQRLWQ